MPSILKSARWLLIGCAAIAPLSGCHTEQRVPGPEPLSETPIKVDSAMELRQWPLSSAYYASDRVRAGSTYSPLRASPLDWPWNAFTETPLFVADTIYILPGVFIEAPWQQFTYKSMSMPPTYTAMPPLPPGPEPTPVYKGD